MGIASGCSIGTIRFEHQADRSTVIVSAKAVTVRLPTY
jgi:hypothetical protein